MTVNDSNRNEEKKAFRRFLAVFLSGAGSDNGTDSARELGNLICLGEGAFPGLDFICGNDAGGNFLCS